ncbi:MAG: trypsin-like peptidase domain-containing protein [Kineosporiaceae bacterium]|nr:trypsin-like peptidase domain-containing protein [Kineosporiaceae bacterium]
MDASETDFEPLGTAVVIDKHRLLTSAHVLPKTPSRPWIAFPMAEDPLGERRRVVRIRRDSRPVFDVAVLELNGPAPLGVEPAPLRFPPPDGLVGKRWWALGFADGDPRGNSADGLVGEHTGYGWVRLDVESRYVIEHGLSGSGLWSPDYGAVVGIVGSGNKRGDGQAISLLHVDRTFFTERIRALGESRALATVDDFALASWGWTLAGDPEAGRHWRPRARGVSIDSEQGFRFCGRQRALAEISEWLDYTRQDRAVLVVTGSPGVGKSAVLGRVVTTADSAFAASLPATDDAVRATVGSVACAVHAKGRSALDVALEIAKSASAKLPERTEDLLGI